MYVTLSFLKVYVSTPKVMRGEMVTRRVSDPTNYGVVVGVVSAGFGAIAAPGAGVIAAP